MIGGPAAYAVWGFYALSGYLMTLVPNEKYGFSPCGLARFAANRALRIYPAYFAVCFGMFLLFYFAPGDSARFLPNLTMPLTVRSWLCSLTLLTKSDGGELLHGSAALRVEMWFYIAMALGLCRSRRVTTAWFAASAAYTVWLLRRDTPFAERYVFIAACSLPFSVGAMVYHWREKLPVIRSPWAAVAAAAIWWLHVWFGLNIKGGPWLYGLYTSLAVSVFAMITLMNLQAKSLPPRLVALDRLLGKRPGKWGAFDDGQPITREHRLLYRDRADLQQAFPNPYDTSDVSNSYFHWFEANGRRAILRRDRPEPGYISMLRRHAHRPPLKWAKMAWKSMRAGV